MMLRCSLRRLTLFALVVVAACHAPADRDRRGEPTPAVTASASIDEAAAGDAHRRSCGRHIQACTAAQAGQPCDPNNLNVLCTPQSNGSFCCLASAQQ